MTTRWGSCNTGSRSITLNIALAEHPPEALESVLVHEMVHLWERGHGPRFQRLMDEMLPDWRARWEHRTTAMRETTANAEAQPIADEPGIKERVSAFVHRVRNLSLFECLTGSGLTGRSRRY